MKVYLVQHGEAVAKEVDPERPLTEAGRGDVHRLAAFLSARNLHVSHVIHSGKTRAQQTAQLLGGWVGSEGTVEAALGLNPNDPPDQLLARLQMQKEELMVVGHMPFLGRLVSRLILGRDDPGLLGFQPGSMACLERIEGGVWQVAWLLRPDILPALF
ncbi:MAG TPA: phosphohistidine phosphatase SixA [Gammaproteobacteria bacterium]|nr:phosphohistidine phosphatase SixA [Gammaproteobacteria bacterium]